MMPSQYKTFSLIIAYAILATITGCKKFLEVSAPITNVNGANVYSIDASAISVLTGVYTLLSNGDSHAFATGSRGIFLLSGLSADEYTLYRGVGNLSYSAYYTNNLATTVNFSYGTELWEPLYGYIFTCNSAIEGLTTATSLTPAVRQQLLGEAKFMRGFFYFYLVNLFGDVPLVVKTDYQINSLLPRSPKAQIWSQIITDLQDAQKLLNPEYLTADALTAYPISSQERVRPNRAAATALLARAYLYTGNWANAQAQASEIINNSSVYSLGTLNDVFLKNSSEAIWQLQPVNAGWNTEDGKIFILPSSGPGTDNPVYISPELLHSFEPGDQRRTIWIDSIIVGIDTFYYPHKYKSASYGAPVDEYLMVLRLGELYLIRAEARVQLGHVAEAQSDLNIIRNRAGLPNVDASTKNALMAAILHERKVELFSEWGHRWLDLKRTKNVDAVMTFACQLKGSMWKNFQQWYPIPLKDIETNPNLIQTQGY